MNSNNPRNAGIYRFTSQLPDSKVYGRLDFLSPMTKRRQSKRQLAYKALQQPNGRVKHTLNQSATISYSQSKYLKDTMASHHSKSIRASAANELRSTRQSFRRLQVSRQQPHRAVHSSRDNPQTPAAQKTISQLHIPSAPPRSPELATTKNSLLSKSLVHHPASYHHDNCVCDHCNCGKHLCQFEAIIPSMQIDSMYNKDYSPRRALPPLAFKPAAEHSRLSPVNPAVDLVSTYLGDYLNRQTKKPEPSHPADHLKFKGPCGNLTTSHNEYPGHKGDNQYVQPTFMQVKPTDKYYLKGVPFDGRTVSKQAYLPLNLSSPSAKIEKHDSLKNLALWLGDSSYRSNYHPPMQRYYPKLEGIKVDQYRPSPDVSARFDTVYRNEFHEKQQTICKAGDIQQRKTLKEHSRTRSIFMPMAFTSPQRQSPRQHAS